MVKQLSYAERFLNAYNTIDHTLRSLYGIKKSMTFTDVIRKSVMFNSLIRKYEDDLLDYGRLRNAIIHRTNPNFIIAEPHDDVVEKIEKLANIISTPPLAIDRIGTREVITIQSGSVLSELMKLMSLSSYSNIPIYDNENLVGVANGQRLLDVLGKQILAGVEISEYISKTTLAEVVSQMEESNYYVIESEYLTIESALRHFETNRKLLAILITVGGKHNTRPTGIITVADVVEMQSILNIY